MASEEGSSGQPPGATATRKGIVGQSRSCASDGSGGTLPVCQRDILPLPTVRTVSREVSCDGCSRTAEQRRLKRAYGEGWAEDCVRALNEMSGQAEKTFSSSAGPTVMQRCALRHVLRSCLSMGCPLQG